jgi:hypothetical protein
MAEEKYDEHVKAFFLDLARQGKVGWNKWRQKNKDVRVTFAGINFSEAPGNEIDFSGFEFGDYADFSGCAWPGAVGSKSSEVFQPGRACFAYAAFGHEARFDGATFGDGAFFYGVAFDSQASFTRTTFGDGAIFNVAAFGAQATFTRTTFGDGAIFNVAAFGAQATFDGAAFGDEASFYCAARA